MKFDVNEEEIKTVIGKTADRTMKMDMTWDWPCGVAYYGICRAYEATGEKRYLSFLQERIDEFTELGLPESWTVNTCAMGHSLITLYENTGEEKYWNLVLSKADYLRNQAQRFGQGTLQHTVSGKNDFPEQAWADTLFMAAYFLLRIGVKVKDEEMINDALDQYFWHIRYLQDLETGLWYHGYDNIGRNNMSGIYWGRANAWASYTMARVGKILPEAYLYPKYMDITGSLSEQLSALKFLQTERGLWRTILDDEDSYEEVSASCGIAAAMYINGNPLYMKYIRRALAGVLDNISKDGKVRNVSAGTAVMNDKEGYRNISKDWIQGWGQGLALTFLAEILSGNSGQ